MLAASLCKIEENCIQLSPMLLLSACPCQKIYIGKTNQEVKQRIVQHRSRIKTKVVTALMVSHFVGKKPQ